MYDELVKRLEGFAVELRKAEDALLVRDAADAIEELGKLNAEITRRELKLRMEKPRWIPVTERLPAKGTNVLVVEFGKVELAYTTTYTSSGSLCWVVINGGCYHQVNDKECPIKWWMTLPEPPKEE
jgi:hypothetical protein